MGTTISVGDDLVRRLRREADQTRVPFKTVLNRALRVVSARFSPNARARRKIYKPIPRRVPDPGRGRGSHSGHLPGG